MTTGSWGYGKAGHNPDMDPAPEPEQAPGLTLVQLGHDGWVNPTEIAAISFDRYGTIITLKSGIHIQTTLCMDDVLAALGG